MPRYARRSARVLLIDSQDRVLLLRSALLSEQAFAWFTPGGGVKWWERLPAAAARELCEEVGLQVNPRELRLVAFATGRADLGFANGLFRDDFFLHRVDAHEVDVAGQTDLERRNYAGFRWWSVADLETTGETVFPFGLAELLTRIVGGQIPAMPVELPWHNPT
ncbi:NUDIX domain-containing protein [Actinoplanes sp. LDG1-06]|uniref:NUDIX domain-containing protein n=1 Tax=Paractinoplanes ovalisporus TaxID=2810368 RepID=A0ABS2AWF3_9ACTN|nr:NUDIX domain-containing protein [Actinoplanes ovalisporus]MBM2623723.1 NUDIX domain-containing protein [Actinoplanes ovalisporus]